MTNIRWFIRECINRFRGLLPFNSSSKRLKDDNDNFNFYSASKQYYLEKYWKNNDGKDIFSPNGFKKLPFEIYNAFCEQVTDNGKILDLGCGNGLMLKYIMWNSSYTLIPYGIDYCEPSIKQARHLIFPEYKQNFTVENIIKFNFKDAPYKFIFLNPCHIYESNFDGWINKVINACAKDGKIIMYLYDDVKDFNKVEWVGQLPQVSGLNLKRRDYPHVSIGIYKK